MRVYGDDLLDNDRKGAPCSRGQDLSTSGFCSFVLIVDDQGEVVDIHSPVALPKEDYMKIAETAWKMKDKKSLAFNGEQWQYEMTPLSVNVIQDNDEKLMTDHLRSEERRVGKEGRAGW